MNILPVWHVFCATDTYNIIQAPGSVVGGAGGEVVGVVGGGGGGAVVGGAVVGGAGGTVVGVDVVVVSGGFSLHTHGVQHPPPPGVHSTSTSQFG